MGVYKTLGETAPREFLLEFQDTPAYKLRDVKVVSTHETHRVGHGWPGPHRNVHVWWELENGKRVGWNESPSRGWSFPVI